MPLGSSQKPASHAGCLSPPAPHSTPFLGLWTPPLQAAPSLGAQQWLLPGSTSPVLHLLQRKLTESKSDRRPVPAFAKNLTGYMALRLCTPFSCPIRMPPLSFHLCSSCLCLEQPWPFPPQDLCTCHAFCPEPSSRCCSLSHLPLVLWVSANPAPPQRGLRTPGGHALPAPRTFPAVLTAGVIKSLTVKLVL